MTKLQSAVVSLTAITLTACGGGQSSSLNPQIVVLEKKVDELERKISNVEFRMEMKQWESIAYLTPGSDGYNVIKMDLGTLTVSISNVQPYANGSKVSLIFGNLTSATIDGIKAKIEWGSVDEKGMPINKDAKSREISPTDQLLPGNWNKVDLVLEGVPPSSLGFIRIRDLGHRAIRLRS